jgi:hypothetical protein
MSTNNEDVAAGTRRRLIKAIEARLSCTECASLSESMYRLVSSFSTLIDNGHDLRELKLVLEEGLVMASAADIRQTSI